MKRWIKRILIGLTIILLFTVVTPLISYYFWYRSTVQSLEANSQIATTALGTIEYASVGNGIPFLYLHGTPGGYDQTLLGYSIFPEQYANQQLIAVSRPGYLRTPVESGVTFEQQADLYAALLDELNIDKAVLYAASGGGYSGVQFALRHPDRLHAAVFYAPALGYEPLQADSGEDSAFSRFMIDFLNWSVGGIFMNALAPSFIPNFDPNDPEEVEFTRGLTRGAIPIKARQPGIDNDLLQRSFPEVDDWPFEEIEVPTLIMHGDADENSDYSKSVDMANRMPNATLVTYEGADHFILITEPALIRSETRRFVEEIMARETE